MSTHILDVSGARPLTTTLNDPAQTRAVMSAKAGDDVVAQVNACREVRMVLPPGAKIERRRYVKKTIRKENGVALKDPENDALYLYDETPYEELVLVVTGGGVTVFGRTSLDPAAPAFAVGATPPYEGTPHTTLSVKRWTEQHFTESGTLVDEETVEGLAGQPEGIVSSLFDAPPPGGDVFPPS